MKTMRNTSKVAPAWWDYTTLDKALLDEAAALDEKDLRGLARDGFAIRMAGEATDCVGAAA